MTTLSQVLLLTPPHRSPQFRISDGFSAAPLLFNDVNAVMLSRLSAQTTNLNAYADATVKLPDMAECLTQEEARGDGEFADSYRQSTPTGGVFT